MMKGIIEWEDRNNGGLGFLSSGYTDLKFLSIELFYFFISGISINFSWVFMYFLISYKKLSGG